MYKYKLEQKQLQINTNITDKRDKHLQMDVAPWCYKWVWRSLGMGWIGYLGANKWFLCNLIVLQFVAGRCIIRQAAASGSEAETPSAEVCNQIESDQCNHNQQCAICSNAKSN